MRIAPLTKIAFGLTLSLAAPAAGQICAGFVSFAGAPLRVTGSAGVNSHVRGFGLTLTSGHPGTFFGGVGLGATHFDALNGSSLDLVAGGGYEWPLDQRERFQLCPGVTVAHSAGPNSPYGDYSETDVTASLRLGGVVLQSRHVRVIPSVGLGLQHAHQTVGGLNSTTEATASHDFGVLTLRTGAVFGRAVTLLPEVSVPIWLADGSATFDLALAANFRF